VWMEGEERVVWVVCCVDGVNVNVNVNVIG
jgi:hypothetical protein